MEFELNQSLKKARIWIVGCYVVILIALIVMTTYLYSAFHIRLANSITNAARNSLVIQDFRNAIHVIETGANETFDQITFTSKTGSVLFDIHKSLHRQTSLTSILAVQKTFYIGSNNLEKGASNESNELSSLTFQYGLETPILYSLAIWIFLLLMAIPIFFRFKQHLEAKHLLTIKTRESDFLGRLAQQLSHDIRSPLAALNLIVKSVHQYLPADNLRVLEHSIQRINDIANDLLQNHANKSCSIEKNDDLLKLKNCSSFKPVDIKPILLNIINEKKILIQDRDRIEIRSVIQNRFSYYTKINPAEFSRMISNLINNSIESFDDQTTGMSKINILGIVSIELTVLGDTICLSIEDNGKGIPKHLLSRLGERGFSSGKAGSSSGSGLGVFHAHQTVESFGGSLKIESTQGQGTKILIFLPRIPTPSN